LPLPIFVTISLRRCCSLRLLARCVAISQFTSGCYFLRLPRLPHLRYVALFTAHTFCDSLLIHRSAFASSVTAFDCVVDLLIDRPLDSVPVLDSVGFRCCCSTRTVCSLFFVVLDFALFVLHIVLSHSTFTSALFVAFVYFTSLLIRHLLLLRCSLLRFDPHTVSSLLLFDLFVSRC
jgi:hypothetical protein